jgi:hypothetical protein
MELSGDVVDVVGVEEIETVELQMVRWPERPQQLKRMPWLRRTYRSWLARRAG